MGSLRRATRSLHDHRIVALAAVVGALTGVVVALFERIVRGGVIDRLLEAPLALQVVAPLVGFGVAGLVLTHLARGAGPSLADDYLRAYHDRETRLRLRDLPAKLLAGAATLAGGAAMGFEAAAILSGATIGSTVQRRTSRWFTREESRVLLVAGAAAGVGAIFKAPATGALFAMEVPFRADLARRTLLPTLFASAAGYLTFVAVDGPSPLFPIGSVHDLRWVDLAAAVALGLLAGGGARAFAWAVRTAKARTAGLPLGVRVLVGGAAVGALVAGSDALTGEPLALGPGYDAIRWAFEPGHAAGVIFGLLLLRGLATIGAVAAGGAGGLFIPLVIEGALLGRLVAELVGAGDSTLLPVLGVAAFLGAGYHVPLAAVVFVAEATGRPGFVVPGLIAAASAQLTMGPRSVTTYQRDRRMGHLEGRLDLPVATAVRTDAVTAPPTASVADVISTHLLGSRLLSVPVVDGATYLGVASLHDLTGLDPERWADTPVSEVMDVEVPAVPLTATVGETLALLEDADADRLPVTDDRGFVGVVSTSEILRLDEVLEATEAGRQRAMQDRQKAV
ncbi:MAG: chloride channel protein [Acidimicrobiales bacterium]